jgi:hypothetical protein
MRSARTRATRRVYARRQQRLSASALVLLEEVAQLNVRVVAVRRVLHCALAHP